MMLYVPEKSHIAKNDLKRYLNYGNFER